MSSVHSGSSASSWRSSPSHSSGGSSTRRYKDKKLPNTPAVNALVYFTGRRPKQVRSVRVYQTTWDPEDDDQSQSSWSSSWSSGQRTKTEIYLLEARRMYWDDYSSVTESRKPSGGRASRSSRRSGGDPWAKGGGRAATVMTDDDDDEDDSSDAESLGDYGHHQGGGGPGPGMMPPPPMHHFPQGAFQPGFGAPPQGFHPGLPPHGFSGPPPMPPNMGRPSPAPGHFVRGTGGIQVFTTD
ncbi:hypothetical protein B0H66DRAFT_277454 [Apodospora peruviana]|uniref:Uncharacterized protein n=1 Tax=Apodospora peruviana TaxID=516989 RepID=A0AAE0HZZ7_9PEZI|nr:hypothetical protein B0H66DRAFT_277454 [Apodospora peruviana]